MGSSMSISNLQRVAAMRRTIDEFLSDRLKEKLERLEDESEKPLKESNRDELEKAAHKLRQQFEFGAWIADAARRVTQIQVATHTLKPIHPNAKGTNLYKPPTTLAKHGLVGSCSLGSSFESDVAGNAAALDVYKFLKLPFEGSSLLGLLLADDPDLAAVLSDNADQSMKLSKALTGIATLRGKAASHMYAKQLYWLIGRDANEDQGYHLLAPLFATSLAHRVFQTINADRFSDASKEARAARKSGKFTDHIVHDYPNLAVQKLGGTKPQNISQLNSERRGRNYLLASLPPRWKSIDLRPLLNTDSMFHSFGRRPEVKNAVRALLAFLLSNPAVNVGTRNRRDELVGELVSELSVFKAEIRTLPPGWSQSPDCHLSAAERRWLDPDGVVGIEPEQPEQPVAAKILEQISQAFGRWLNRELRDPLPMGDPEYLHWCGLAQAELDDEEKALDHAH